MNQTKIVCPAYWRLEILSGGVSSACKVNSSYFQSSLKVRRNSVWNYMVFLSRLRTTLSLIYDLMSTIQSWRLEKIQRKTFPWKLFFSSLLSPEIFSKNFSHQNKVQEKEKIDKKSEGSGVVRKRKESQNCSFTFKPKILLSAHAWNLQANT